MVYTLNHDQSKVQPDLRIYADADTLSREAASDIGERINGRVSTGQTFSMVLSGGTTPETLYGILAAEFRDRIPWRSVHLFWGDERYVPANDPLSNYAMVKRALLRDVPIPDANIHPMPTDLPDPDKAARAYESILKAYFGPREPRFDLILLGMGEEGHTASLFPGSPALDEPELWVVAVHAPVQPPVRLSLSLRVLNLAESVFFLVAGAKKAPALLRALFPAEVPSPAARVRPNDGQVVWWADPAAAEFLPDALRKASWREPKR